MFRCLKESRGFSYIEVLSVITVIVIISTVVIANMRTGSSPSELFVSAQKIISDIRLVQNMAISASDLEGTVPGGGWGIRFVKGQNYYSIYADLSDDYGASDFVCLNDCNTTSEELYKNIDLPPDTIIDKIYKIRTLDGAEISADEVTVTFEPPDPKVHMCETEIDCEYDKIGIVVVNSNLDKREIIVNFFGLVDTKDVFY